MILLLAIAGLAVAGCLGPIRDLYPPRAGEGTVIVQVVKHGWHSGLVIERDAIAPAIWPAQVRFPAGRFLEIGWGDRAFYQSPTAGSGLALRAAFASEGSVLHVTGLDRPPAEAFPAGEIVSVVITRRGAEALGHFVSGAYARDAAGAPVDLGPGLYPGSRFYAATGRYSLIYTCNTWIADALRAAGCPITPTWALTASNLIAQAKRCAPDPAQR
jgi:uncharacterized protein (TIGR02117 family)